MRITLIGTGFPSLESPYKSEKNETNISSSDRPLPNQESTRNNKNDLDIPPFLRK